MYYEETVLRPNELPDALDDLVAPRLNCVRCRAADVTYSLNLGLGVWSANCHRCGFDYVTLRKTSAVGPTECLGPPGDGKLVLLDRRVILDQSVL